MPAPSRTDPAPADPAHAALERALTRVVRRVLLPTTGEATRREAGVQLERATYVALTRIVELDGGRLGEVAAALGIDASTASRHARTLVDAGYVAVTTDPNDARARRYHPTPAGHQALARIREVRLAHLASILTGWEETDVARLAADLERLLDAIEAHEAAGP